MNRELRVGLLVLIAAVILGYMFSLVSSNRSLPTETWVYYTLVEDSTGLGRNAAIKVAGIDVGRVREKELQNNKAHLTLEIATTVAVHSDALVTLRTIGYLGDRYLDLDPGTEQAPLLPQGSMIPSKEGATLESLMAQSQSLFESWTGVAQDLSALFGGGG